MNGASTYDVIFDQINNQLDLVEKIEDTELRISEILNLSAMIMGFKDVSPTSLTDEENHHYADRMEELHVKLRRQIEWVESLPDTPMTCKCGHSESSHYGGVCMAYISPTDQMKLCECAKFEVRKYRI